MQPTLHVSILAPSSDLPGLEACLTRANIAFSTFHSIADLTTNSPQHSPVILPPHSRDGAFAPAAALRLRCSTGFEVTPIVAYLPQKDLAVIKTLTGAGVDQVIIEPIDPDLLALQLHSLSRMSQTVTEELLDARLNERLPEQLASLINAIPNPSAILDGELNPILSNKTFAKFTTLTPNEPPQLNGSVKEAINSLAPNPNTPSVSLTFELGAPFNQSFTATLALLAPGTKCRLAFIAISGYESSFASPPYVSGLIQHLPIFALLLTRSEERKSINALNKLLDNIEAAKSTLPLDSAIQSLLEILDQTFPTEISLNIRYSVESNLGADTLTAIKILTNLVFFAAAAIQFRGDVAIQVNSNQDSCRIVLRAVPDHEGVKDLSELLETHAAEELSQVKSLVQNALGTISADADSSAIAIEVELPVDAGL